MILGTSVGVQISQGDMRGISLPLGCFGGQKWNLEAFIREILRLGISEVFSFFQIEKRACRFLNKTYKVGKTYPLECPLVDTSPFDLASIAHI